MEVKVWNYTLGYTDRNHSARRWPEWLCCSLEGFPVLHQKLASTATAFTVTIMFSAIVWLAPFVQHLSGTYGAVTGLATAMASIGIYKTLASALMWLFAHILFLRKIFLWKGFLEGTWVGHYEVAGEHRFTIEFYDQSSGDTTIFGREFDEQHKTRATWSSDAASVNLIRRHVIYVYTCNVFTNRHVQEGLGMFTIHQENSRFPNKLDGYAADLIDGDRDPNVEWKISDKAVDDATALQRAKEIFKV